MKDDKTQLLELIDTLSEKQITFFLAFMKRLLGRD